MTGQSLANASVLLLFALKLLTGSTGVAQEGKVVPVSPEKPYTLHVYEDLVQVPSLVLDAHNQAYEGLKSQDFNLRLDSGPAFHPTHTRMEGDDAVSFAFLIDASPQEGKKLVAHLEKSAAALPLDTLQAKDEVAVYAFDCHLVRSVVRESTTPLDTLQTGVEAALRSSALHSSSETSRGCHRRVSLWDAMVAVINHLRTLPGRRVLVVISDGNDGGSRRTWEETRLAASVNSIAVFALRPFWMPVPFDDVLLRRRLLHAGVEDPLGLLCGGSGGLSMRDKDNDVGRLIQETVKLVRSRYILEFPRAANGTGGLHALEVSATKAGLTVRAAGISVPVQDKTLLADPSTVPTDTSRIPVMGNRKIVTPH